MVRDASGDVTSLAALYAAKAAAEEDAADALLPSLSVRRSGDPDARVLLVKGEPGPFDLAGGEAVRGPDREAARSALEALGVDMSSVLAIVSRPGGGAAAGGAASKRLAIYLEASDPAVVVALDGVASEDLAAAAGLSALPYGKAERVRGRVLLAVDGLEASLTDEARKKRVWAQFKELKRPT